MMARNRCTRRRSVCMWHFQLRSLSGFGEFVGSLAFLAIIIVALNVVIL